MKRLTLILWLALGYAFAVSQPAAVRINGTVCDESGQPVPFVNVYVQGSMDGASTAEDGSFAFATAESGTITLAASFIGYQPFSVTDDVKNLRDLRIVLKAEARKLNEVVVYAGDYQLKSASTISSGKAVELVSTAGSEGDLYKAIAMLPGTQVADRDGRLLVRGGSGREAQTYIDDMHVLSPYTAAFGEVGSRGRYSPFLFEGINFSLGGYVPEYSQSLSAVLPLYTRNEAGASKWGVDVMNVSLGGSGTKAWRKASVSFNVNYTDLSLYNALFFPSLKSRWKKPYRQIGGQSQLRFTLGKDAFLKTYFDYSATRFTMVEKPPFGTPPHDVSLGEDNLYFNTTFRKKFGNGLRFFSGAAVSRLRQRIDNACMPDDALRTDEREIHLKTKAEKRLADFYKLTVGGESLFKRYAFSYLDDKPFESSLAHAVAGAFVSSDFNLSDNLFFNLSSRIEYTSLSRHWQLLPRAAAGYRWGGVTFSGVVGAYQQNAENEVLLYNRKLLPEKNVQALIGLYYQKDERIFRAEAYCKSYRRLPLKSDNQSFHSSNGKGYARGIDLFFNDVKFLKHWQYTFAYSCIDARRRYLDYPEAGPPPFAMRHNASAALRYTNWSIRSIIGISNRFATGRPYHDPNRAGFMNAETPVYNSLDASWIFLPNRRMIIYLGFANILNRKNVFGYAFNPQPDANGRHDAFPLTQQVSQGLYIGCFITLGKNTAYDTANF